MYWERQTAKPQQDIARWGYAWYGGVNCPTNDTMAIILTFLTERLKSTIFLT